MGDDYDLPDDAVEKWERHRKFVETVEECCAMWDADAMFRPAVEEKLIEVMDQFHSADIARLTPHGICKMVTTVRLSISDFSTDIIYAMLYKNDSRPDRYIPSPPEEVEEEPETMPEPQEEILDDLDWKDFPPDPAHEYTLKCEEITNQFFNALIRSMKSLAAEHFPSEIMTLSAEGYRFLDNKIFEHADAFAVSVADLFYMDRFIDGYKQLKIWASERSFTLPHCRPERLDPSLLDEFDKFHTNLYLEGYRRPGVDGSEVRLSVLD